MSSALVGVRKTKDGGPAVSQKRSLKIQLGGGRSSVSGVVVTVFGCTGALGRYVVNSFGRIGSQIVIPYRTAGGDYQIQHLKVMGDVGQVLPVSWDIRDEQSIYNAIKHSNVVVNLTGRLWDTRNFTMEDIHIDGARRIAAIAKEAEIERFVHVSVAGADPNSPSRWMRSKALGEKAVREVFEGATILRPTMFFGPEDRLINSMGQMLRFWPFFPLMQPERKIQPVFYSDVAEAVLAAVANDDTIGRTYDLGGPSVFTNEQLFQLCAKLIAIEPRIVLRDPVKLMEFITKFLEIHRNPRFTFDSMKDRADRVVAPGSLGFSDLGVTTTPLQTKILNIIRRYRRPVRFDEYIEVGESKPTGN